MGFSLAFVAPIFARQAGREVPVERDFELDMGRDEHGKPYFNFPILILSDTHLSTWMSRAKLLAWFMQNTKAGKLCLLGDIIDGEAMLGSEEWKFPRWHRQVIAEICRMIAQGTEAIFVPGNHDEAICMQKMIHKGKSYVIEKTGRLIENGKEYFHRNLCGKTIRGVTFAKEVRYRGPNGLEIEAEHGHVYDGTLGNYSGIGNAVLDGMVLIDTLFQNMP